MLQLSDKLWREAEIAVGGREAWASVVSESQCVNGFFWSSDMLFFPLQFTLKIASEQAPRWSDLASVAYCSQRGGEGETAADAASSFFGPCLHPPVLPRAQVSPGWGSGRAALCKPSVFLALFGLWLPCAACNWQTTILDQQRPERRKKCLSESWGWSKHS